ncbi:beta-1,3-glucosyltransferase-like [Penaeus japonicus]|uniref:beta-1,3-glucosyltransferase-like n=1 Tax=Penaeus japonicus TaxID=27405 RepID=UPI001C7121AF|nr:beta-1,3-glucosyltransferase-like [Penaeus japonicus]XP_042869567.1 beta-1,3-glucosyltransferase-like [Penaeus japonicus]
MDRHLKRSSVWVTAVISLYLIWSPVFCAIEDGIVFVVVNQKTLQHVEDARVLAEDIAKQLREVDQKGVVHVATDEWEDEAAWTYYPLLEKLNSRHGSNSSWCVFLEEQSLLNLGELLSVLQTYPKDKALFLGRSLWDREDTIIHHFDSVDPNNPFLYPDTRAGMALSTPLIKRLTKRWLDATTRPKIDFTIDPQYEFARFVESAGVKLTNERTFCVEAEKEACAVTFQPRKPCDRELQTDEIHVAVKTCSHYHEKRLPVIKDTWLPDAPNYGLYSDREDSDWGTVSLGIPNTERGHCGKTLAIIRHVEDLDTSMKWLAIVDDDTLISIPRLKSLLACYDPDEMVAIGERYGYMAVKRHGYDYITGGGGMVFSRGLVEELADPDVCSCPTNDTPDDMFLGVCLSRLSVPVTHVEGFHQSRPMDYPPELLRPEPLISFHKHWMIDPREIYTQWLDNNPEVSEEQRQSELTAEGHSEL